MIPYRLSLRAFAALLILASWATAADERPTPARLVPAKGLTVLVEYDGVGDRAEAWKATAAYAVLNATPAGETMASVARQVMDRFLKEMPDVKVGSADLGGIGEHVFRHGFLFAVYDEGAGRSGAVAVLSGFGSKDARVRTDRLIGLLTEGEEIPKPVAFRGRQLFQIKTPTKPKPADRDLERQLGVAIEPAPVEKAKDGPKEVMTWWFEGDDLIIADGLPREAGAKPNPDENAKDRVGAILDAIEGKAPSAATHPGREAALAEGRGIDGFAPDGLIVVESAGGGALLQDLLKQVDAPGIPGIAIPKLATPPSPDDESTPKTADPKKGQMSELDELKILGLDRLKRVVARWGFRGKSLMTVVRFEVPAPRTGLFGLFDQPAFRADRLPPIPKDAGAFVVGSFDPGKSYDAIIAQFKTFDPTAAGTIDQAFGEVAKAVIDATGQRLREDLLAHIGPAWTVYTTRSEVWEDSPTAVPTLMVEVRDAEKFAKVLDSLASRVNDTLRGPKPADVDAIKGAVEPPALILERLPAPERGYRLISPEGVVPWAFGEIQPTILLGKSTLVVAMNPALARAAIAAESRPEGRWTAGEELSKTLSALPSGMTSLSVGDIRDSSWPEAISTMPRLVQYLGNLLGASDAAEVLPGPAALTMLGVPAPGGFRIKIDPAKVPRAAQVRAVLFPSVLATVVDDRGIRFIGAEALPFACIGYKSGNAASKGKFNIDLNRLFNR